MYSKPLASPMEGPKTKPARVMRGAPVTGGAGAVNFASFMPQGGASPMGGLPGQGMATGKAGTVSPRDLAAQSGMGLNQTKAMATLAKMLNTAEAAQPQAEGAAAQRSGLPLSKQDLFRISRRQESAGTKAAGSFRGKKTRSGDMIREAILGAIDSFRQKDGDSVGHLAAQFESGKDGAAAIGYDRHGGTSYGKYQIASRVGTMKSFIGFLKSEAPDLAGRLEKAGPMNTGGRRGRMPDEWRKIASEQPDRFEKLQDKFIHASHFTPAIKALAEKTGLPVETMPKALQEVVFSTAVQHGPAGASRIIGRAFDQVGETRLDPDANSPANLAKAQENLIRRIYDTRSGQFRSSTKSVQAAVKSRLRQEMTMAIGMLRQEHTGTMA